MPAINANIVVDTTTLTLSPSTTSIGVTVDPINLQVVTVGPQGIPTQIVNGTSNVTISTADANIDFSVAGANVATMYTTGAAYPGFLTVNGNITAQNDITVASGANLVGDASLNIATANSFGLTKFNESYVSGGTVNGTITPDASTGTIYKYVVDGAITLNSITNVVAGTSMTIILQQDATGGRTLTSTWKYLKGFKTLSTAASSTDIISVFYDGTDYYAVLSDGFI